MKKCLLGVILLFAGNVFGAELISGKKAEILFYSMEGKIHYPVCDLEKMNPREVSLSMLLRKFGRGEHQGTSCFYAPDFSNGKWNHNESGDIVYNYKCFRN